MNSRYAPVVALTALAILVVGALGIFLGIKPLVDSASSYAAREELVRANIQVISADEQKIDSAKKALEQAPDLSNAIALNAPDALRGSEFEDRLAAAIRSSAVEVAGVTFEPPSDVLAWSVPDAVRPSAAVAAYFQSAPLAREGGEAGSGVVYEPVVKVLTGDAVVKPWIVKVNVTIKVKGTAVETQAFLAALADPAQRLFQVNDVWFEGKYVRDTPLVGVSEYADGDVVSTVIGSLYLLNPTTDVVDEESLTPWAIPGDRSPFTEPENIDPQPGAK